jgi:hypothetical protein
LTILDPPAIADQDDRVGYVDSASRFWSLAGT